MKQYNWRYYSVFVLSPLWFALLVFLALSFEGNITIAFWMALWAGIGGVIIGFIPAILTAFFSICIHQRVSHYYQRCQSFWWVLSTVLTGTIISVLSGFIIELLLTYKHQNFNPIMLVLFGLIGIISTLLACLFLLYQQYKLNKRE